MVGGGAMFSRTALFIILGVLAVILLILVIALIIVSSKNKKNSGVPTPPVPNQGMVPPVPPMQPVAPPPIPEPRVVEPPIAPPVMVNGENQAGIDKTVVLNNAGNAMNLTIEISLLDNPQARFRANLPDGGSVIVGRNVQNSDISLINDTSVSGRHCEFSREGVGVYVSDLGSTNGTFIGDTRITDKVAIPDSTVLTIGRSSYIIKYIWV